MLACLLFYINYSLIHHLSLKFLFVFLRNLLISLPSTSFPAEFIQTQKGLQYFVILDG